MPSESKQPQKPVKVRPVGNPGYAKRGRPPKRGKPSFNGPQPLQQHSTDEDVSEADLWKTPTKPKSRRGRPRIYSMVAAARIGAGASESGETSHDVTPPPIWALQMDAGGPPSKRRRIIFGKSASPELELSSDISPPVHANNAGTAISTQPRVIIPLRSSHGELPEKDSEDSKSATRRRCQRCKKQRQRCDDERPCQRCHRANIGAGGCVDDDEVRVVHRVNQSTNTTTSINIPTPTPIDDNGVIGILIKKFQPTRPPSQRTSSPDSIPSGRNIVVERYAPTKPPLELDEQLLPASSPKEKTPSSELMLSDRRTTVKRYDTVARPLVTPERCQPTNQSSLDPSSPDSLPSAQKIIVERYVPYLPTTPQKAASWPHSLTPYYPTPTVRDKLQKTARRKKDTRKQPTAGYTPRSATTTDNVAGPLERPTSIVVTTQTPFAVKPSQGAPSRNGKDTFVQGEDSDAVISSGSSMLPHQKIAAAPHSRLTTSVRAPLSKNAL